MILGQKIKLTIHFLEDKLILLEVKFFRILVETHLNLIGALQDMITKKDCNSIKTENIEKTFVFPI